MGSYRDSILRHEKEMNRIKAAIHETVKHRDKPQPHRDMWLKATAEYHNYRTSIDDWMRDISQSEIFDWEDARDFTFQYLSVDPVYHGSGYAKEMLVKKLKKCEFSLKEAEVLRILIIRRIQSGGQREFKKFCQLIPKIQTRAFCDEVTDLANAKDASVSSRGKIALRYLNDE